MTTVINSQSVDEQDRIFVTAEGTKDPHSFGQNSWGVRPDVNVGDVLLFYVARTKTLGHAARAASEAARREGDKYATAKIDPASYFRFDPPITLDELRADDQLADWSVLSGRPFSNLDKEQPGPLTGRIRDAIISRIEANNRDFAEWLDPTPRVWVTAGKADENPSLDLDNLQPGHRHTWAVSEKCRHGDYVLFWVNGVGFRYITRVRGQVRSTQTNEYGPAQTMLQVVARLENPVSFEMLRSSPEMQEWPLVKLSMQAPARNQRTNLLEEKSLWTALRGLLAAENQHIDELLDKIERRSPTRTNLLRSRFAGYARDVPDGSRDADLLNLAADVNTLATTLCAKSVEPPLAIGLFGEWGSGKSFFIQQVMREVREISAMVAEKNRSTENSTIAFLEHTYQIEFNAWHYSEGDLWASLVDHIFTSLRDQLNTKLGSKKEADEALEGLLAELDTAERAQSAAREKIDALKRKIDEAEKALEVKRAALAAKAKEMAVTERRDLWSDVTLNKLSGAVVDLLKEQGKEHGLPEVGNDIQQIVAAARRLEATGGRSRAIFRSIRIQGLKPWRIVVLLTVLAIALFIGPVVKQSLVAIFGPQDFHTLTATFAQILVFLGGVTKWLSDRLKFLGPQLDSADRFLDNVEQAGREVEELVRENERKRSRDVAAAEAEIARLQIEIEAAFRERSEAETRQIQLMTQIEERRPERVLADFLEERANSNDYRDKLGIMALVRRDFKKLSDLLIAQRDSKTVSRRTPEKPLPKIDRIILYIDDLDRCKQRKVVEVLRAVHLLLAFDIFVVVVAVDARWVSRSLEIEHQQLLVRSDGAIVEVHPEEAQKGPPAPPPHTTSVDYLEKIFQIPFWVPAFSKRASGRMVHGLLREQILDEETERGSQEKFDRVDVDAIINRLDEKSVVPVRHLPKQRSLAPDNLKLSSDEISVLIRVAPLAGQTPRQIKRFTNLYRLLKVGLGDRDLDRFVGRDAASPPGFEAAVLVLAMVTGASRATTELFELINTSAGETSLKQLANNILSPAEPNDPLTTEQRVLVANNAEVAKAAKHLADVAVDFGDVTVRRLKEWIVPVSRYSFYGANTAG